jgi:hypothetical protein
MKKKFHIEKERSLFEIISIALDAAIDAHRGINKFILIVTRMPTGDKPRPRLAHIEQTEALARRIHEHVCSYNRHPPAKNTNKLRKRIHARAAQSSTDSRSALDLIGSVPGYLFRLISWPRSKLKYLPLRTISAVTFEPTQSRSGRVNHNHQ